MAAAKRGYAEVLNNLTALLLQRRRFTRLILKTKKANTIKPSRRSKSLKLWKLFMGARGLVVMAKAMTLKQTLNAVTVQGVIDNFSQYQVVAQAKTELARIKNVQAKPTHP
jgi:hypothetical protein